ncbi:MAG TPA: methyltransferase domain-containing protein [Candidatus Saccharimonadales bacterium]|nr:methyltransferase domain-containing protein [Candidatus Saccharimonadales bacterium]
MFLSRRSTQAEYSDAPGLPFEVVAQNYADLAKINRLFAFAEPFQRCMVNWLGKDNVKTLRLLDLGAGDGSLGRTLESWASKKGWQWSVTSLDLNSEALRLNPGRRNVVGSVLALPFTDACFDVVIASQMTHHIDRQEDVACHFREAWRVTRGALFLTDLHRNPCLLVIVWLSCVLGGLSRHMRADGVISIQRGWRVREWRRLAEQAGIKDAKTWLYFGSRIILRARK